MSKAHHLSAALLTTFILLAGFGAPARAAEDGGMIFYSLGGNLVNPSPLNTAIQSAGYKGFDSWTWGQGVGLYGVFKRVLVGLEYQSLFGQIITQSQDSMKLDGSYLMLNAGYMAIATPVFQLYPYLGIGRGAMNVRSSQNLNSLLSLSQGSNQNLDFVSAGSWLLDLGVGANVVLPMTPGGSDSRGPAASLKAGYMFALGNTDWSANQLPVSGGPALNPGGFYLRLQLGFGGIQ